jgi:branched-chain amino acid transport system permease protein
LLSSISEFFLALGPTIFSILDLIGVYVILALGLNMINGMAGMFSIGHAGFWAVGAYTAAAITVHNPLGTPWPVTFATGMVGAIFLTALIGGIVAIPCLRLAGDYLAIATLGFAIIIVTLLYNMDFVGAATGISTPTHAGKGFIWLMVLVTLVVYYRLQFSNIGRIIQAIREDEIAAQAIGINKVRYKALVFVVGAGIAGLAGALHANSATYLNPAGFEFDQSIKVLTMVVLGGLGSITGVTVAAIVLTVMPEVLRLMHLEQYQMLVFAGILLVMVLIRPEGVMGKHELWDLPFLRKFWKPSGIDDLPVAVAAAGSKKAKEALS